MIVKETVSHVGALSNFVDVLRYRAEHRPDDVAYIFLSDGEAEESRLTFGQLDQEARRIAAYLKAHCGTGDRILLLYPPGLDFIAGFFGCLYAGSIAVPAYPPNPKRLAKTVPRLQSICSSAEPVLGLTVSSILETLAPHFPDYSVFAQMKWAASDDLADPYGATWRDPALTGDTIAFLQYTSGSTGHPKGVIISHDNLIYNQRMIQAGFEHSEISIFVSWLPLFHDMGLIGNTLHPLYMGIPSVLMSPASFLQRPFRWLDAVSRYRGTTTGAPNFAYDLCVSTISDDQLAQLDLSSLEVAYNGSEPVNAETMERFVRKFSPCGLRSEALFPCYGLAEATLFVTGGMKRALPVTMEVEAKAFQDRNVIPVPKKGNLEHLETKRLVSSGRSWLEQDLVIVDERTGQRVPDGQVGEIWVAGPHVGNGYWQLPQETERTFRAKLADDGSGPYMRTGDLGFLHNGNLFVTGRIKDIILIRGRNHYPQDIEQTVQASHPALRKGSGAAFSITLAGEEQLVVVQEINRNHLRRFDAGEVVRAIRTAVAESHELQVWGIALIKTNSIFKTSSGKIQRRACQAAYAADELQVLAQWPDESRDRATEADPRQPVAAGSATAETPNRQGIRSWLVKRLAARLGLPPEEIRATEPFASFGLDSAALIGLSGELEEWLGRRLSPTLVYSYPSIDTLSAYLAGEAITQDRDKPVRGADGGLDQAIAIIGLGCRLPGAAGPEAFWQMLREGRNEVGEVPGSRRQAGTYQELHDPTESYRGGFLAEVDGFDAGFFKLAAREAAGMDPQHRLLLEVGWEALEDAGILPDKLAGSTTGVFVGISTGDYAQLMAAAGEEYDAFYSTGNASSIAANRLSYFLDLQGPSIAVDTACSSSLVATHLACQNLVARACDLALAGGVNLILSSDLAHKFHQTGVLSAAGRCRTFDADADGYVRGEGCGLVVLKRLTDALRDGDPIRAIIRGSAINHDGRSNGLMAPNGLSQQAVIRQALANAGCHASQISYVEAHGTGTALGDPIEVNALREVLMEDRGPDQTCLIGSVKTNFGHTEAAAGIAGLLKVVLSLTHDSIPPTLHLQQPNPHFAIEGTPLSFPLRLTPWTGSARLAGVSSFGFGGTNAHVVVEEAPPPERPPAREERTRHLLTLSAQSEKALVELVGRYETYLSTAVDPCLEDICYTANTGRARFDHRLALVSKSATGLRQQLQRLITGGSPAGVCRGRARNMEPPPVAFLFTGQGAQYFGMGAELYQTAPVFREVIDRCDTILKPYLNRSLLTVLFPEQSVAAADAGPAASPEALLDQTLFTQSALFTVEYALASLWVSWGISPQVVMGHSLGEYVAACVAGVFSLEDGLRLVAERGRLMQALPQEGRMVTVFTGEEQLTELIREVGDEVAVAAVNGPEVIVISGPRDQIEAVLGVLEERRIRSIPLKISQGFHSPQTEAIMDEFRQILSQATLCPPRLPVISNLTGKPAGAEMATPEYWCRHLRQPVRFADCMQTLHAEGYELLLEIGPEPELLGLDQCLPEGIGADLTAQVQWLPSLRSGVSDWQQMLESLGMLQVGGVPVDWSGFEAPYDRRRVPLPTYPFQRRRFWASPAGDQESLAVAHPQPMAQTPLLDLLAQGKTQELEQLLAGEGTLSPAVAKALPQIVQAFSRRHRQEATASAIEDWLYRPDWQPRERRLQEDAPTTEPGVWLILADQSGLGGAVAQLLAEPCYLVYAGGQYLRAGEDTWYVNPANAEDFDRLLADVMATAPVPLKGILHLWSLETPASEWLVTALLPQVKAKGCGSSLLLVQALAKRFEGTGPRLWLITRGAVQVERFPVSVSVGSALLWGFGKTIAVEHPELWGGLIDLTPNVESEDAARLVRELRDSQGEDQLAFRQGQRFVARLVRTPRLRQLAGKGESSLRADGTYLITGGTGALGLALADWMVRRGAVHLLLTARRGAASPKAATAIDQLSTAGAQVLVVEADVADEAAMARIFTEILPQHPPLTGVVHAAGVAGYEPIGDMTHETFAAVLRPKVDGSWILHQLTRQMELDFFVCFSSMASVLGAKGEAHYVTANQFQDALAHFRRQAGLPALSVNWGPVRGGGMSPPDYLADLARMGVGTIPLTQIPEIFGYLLGVGTTQVMLANLDWRLFKPLYEVRGARPLVEQIPAGGAADEAARPATADHREADTDREPLGDRLLQLQQLPIKEQRRQLVQYIQEAVTGILGYDAAHQPKTHQGFFDMGMNSLMAIELRKRLEVEFAMALPVTVAFDHGNIDALAEYIGEQALGWQASDHAAGPDERIEPETMTTDLSGEEIQSSLNTELEQLEALLARD